MSTKSRILEKALELFNEEGVAALSAVDIATALGISPGHLYYHFKGRSEIVAALAAEYRSEVDMVLDALTDTLGADGASLETLWTYVHILIEEAWDARFLYREAAALVMRSQDLAAVFRYVATRERTTLATVLIDLRRGGVISASPEVIDGVSRLMTTGIGFHAIELELEGDAGPQRERIARAAAQVMLLPAALIRGGQKA
ncbi:TetR/AcrR family transcriptional regulator [Phenylobacterium sp.]|uniref:TetR/AcrR family transcriptional regulator n=1 Tax=Phenylobacterium sp. TaxID=1871053 RepID=UPI0037CBD9E7